jgi:TPR repeat protein
MKIARTTCMLLVGALLLGAPLESASAGKYRGDASVSRIMARAQRGNAHAQAMLGFMYANGHGVPQSYDVAVDWYTKSACQGDPDGQYLLGLMYDKGFGVKADVVQAHKWLNLAAAHAPWPNRENYLRMRNAVGTKMTPAQLDLAQQLAVDFVPARP